MRVVRAGYATATSAIANRLCPRRALCLSASAGPETEGASALLRLVDGGKLHVLIGPTAATIAWLRDAYSLSLDFSRPAMPIAARPNPPLVSANVVDTQGSVVLPHEHRERALTGEALLTVGDRLVTGEGSRASIMLLAENASVERMRLLSGTAAATAASAYLVRHPNGFASAEATAILRHAP
ncbi:MAG: hypothetical protein NVS3B20_09880 [Polyangiales bacterium]